MKLAESFGATCETWAIVLPEAAPVALVVASVPAVLVATPPSPLVEVGVGALP